MSGDVAGLRSFVEVSVRSKDRQIDDWRLAVRIFWNILRNLVSAVEDEALEGLSRQ